MNDPQTYPPQQHRDGIPWNKAPLPSVLHWCSPQTVGWIGTDRVERCACGAIRNPGISTRWMERNSRRRNRGRRRA